jgi:chemotaxis protein methyltransferase CheR
MLKLLAEEFKVLAKYIYTISGVYLDESKTYLIETRLQSLVKELGCASYSELYYRAVSDQTKSLLNRIIDAITTNETLFFRDQPAFELLRNKILPDLIDRKAKRMQGTQPISLRIWSAACSTGQEVYSIAIVLKELLPDLAKYDIRILGTDISDGAVARASYGNYNQFELDRGFPKDKVSHYFRQEKGQWKIRDDIRAMASFRKFNLFDNIASLGYFDLIFCRNVAIYFTDEDRVRLFDKIGKALDTGGCLVIGSTESLTTCSPQFEPKRYLRSVYYQVRQ